MSNQEAEGSEVRSSDAVPFDWNAAGHVVAKAGEAVNWDFTDPDSFIKRVQSIEFGLTAETEFAALLSWLGRCSLVHRLEQDYFKSPKGGEWSIPDLFCLLEHEGEHCPVLIEVKTRKKERLTVRLSELESMRRYANLHSLPLLFAWKPRRLGFWLLVDPVHFVEKDGKAILELAPAMKNNLLSVAAGDFLIVPRAGAGLFLGARVVKKTQVTDSGFEGIAQLNMAEFRDGNGNAVKNIPGAIVALLFTRMEVVDQAAEGEILRSFVSSGESVYAQQVLRTSVAFRHQAEGPIKWRHVAKDLNSYLSRQSLNEEIQKHFCSFVQYQFFQHPQVWPSFLPEAWNALPQYS